MASNPRKRGRKLLLSVSHAAKHLNSMLQYLHITRLIMHFYLENAYGGIKYSSKPYVVYLRWLEVQFPASASFSNSLRVVLCIIVHIYLIWPGDVVVPVSSIAILKFLSSARNSSGWSSSKLDKFIL